MLRHAPSDRVAAIHHALVEQRLPGWHIALTIGSDHARCHIGKSIWPEQDAASAALAIPKALVAASIAQDA